MNPVEKHEIAATGVSVSRLGWGGSGIGNLYRESSPEEAKEVIDAALAEGINYFDTAPMYGRGLSEERLGIALKGRERDSFVVSTKVSELIVRDGSGKKSRVFELSNTRSMINDWTAAGTRRSICESLERLGLEWVDILYIHDTYENSVDDAIRKTYPVLAEMREKGQVKAIGVGMDRCEILSRYVRECDLDCMLLWGSYSLLNYQALEEVIPLCEKNNVSIVSGAPYESGILASDLSRDDVKYRYREAPPEVLERARAMNAVCERHGIPLKAAALQFAFGHPCVISVIPGTRSPQRLRENIDMLAYEIPNDVWDEMKADSLLPTHVPTPHSG